MENHVYDNSRDKTPRFNIGGGYMGGINNLFVSLPRQISVRGVGGVDIWELPSNYPVFTVVMVIYHYVERIWRIPVTPIF